ncbi:MAG: metallophosphoesterase [Magnetococcales bacterium]|nr:metallophosphoesterase [Magnetococcales bacterium]
MRIHWFIRLMAVWLAFWPQLPGAAEQTPLIFFALGDHGSGSADQRRVATAMERVAAQNGGVAFVLLLGDNFYPNGIASVQDPQWQTKFERIYTGPHLERVPFYAILGNHDIRANPEAQVAYGRQRLGSGRWRMAGRNDWLDQGQTVRDGPLVRLILLDATLPLDEQNRFLLESAARQPEPVWRVVASHYPLRSGGPHGDSAELLRHFLPALRVARADLHLSGHDHILQLLRAPDEPVYVVSGAGGHTLYPLQTRSAWSEFAAERFGFLRVMVSETVMELTFHDDEGGVLHRSLLQRDR